MISARYSGSIADGFFQPRPIDRSLTDFSRQRRRVAVERRQGFIIDVFHSRLGLAMVEHQFTAI